MEKYSGGLQGSFRGKCWFIVDCYGSLCDSFPFCIELMFKNVTTKSFAHTSKKLHRLISYQPWLVLYDVF